MNLRITALLLAFAISSIEACHHRQATFPPDRFPEEDFRRRRKRGLAGGDDDIIYTIYPTSQPTAVDANQELSKFFTQCMLEKTGSVFRSWKSVIDFVFRDTRWYSATEEQYCPENSDTDRLSTSCWQGRINFLLKENSQLKSKAKECIQEYAWSQERGSSTLIRGKRQVSTGFSSTRDPCLGVTIVAYDNCIRGGLVTPANLREYPSLRSWDAVSVDKFVKEHVSNCRITSRPVGGRNRYNEVCPLVPSGLPSFLQPTTSPCLSEIYNEIVRTSSPLFPVQKSCTETLSGNQKCRNVVCGNHATCDVTTGLCKCDSSYVENSLGLCVLENKCALVFCGSPLETCNPNNGLCVCITGYERDSTGVCRDINPCRNVVCRDRNQVCNPRTGNCECPPGYSTVGGLCVIQPADPCRGVTCGANQKCINFGGRGYCICESGFRFVNRECVGDDICSRIDCGANAECSNINGRAMCSCISGYVRINDACIRRNPCAGVRCDPNMRCVSGNCVCRNGFVPAPNNRPGCVPQDPCASVRCPANSNCVNGDCVCDVGFELVDGRCRRRNPCAGVRCGPNMRCVSGNCVCRSGFVRAPNNRPGCVRPDPCASVRCPANSKCVNGDCVCDAGFELVDGRCRRLNPCAGVRCGPNMRCVSGNCVCRSGFVRAPNNRPGCVRPDPCASVRCPANSNCVNGDCVCDAGFELVDGRCRRLNPCSGVRCGPNMRCVGGNCVCRNGFVPAPNNRPGCVTPDPCDSVQCPTNSECRNGNCECVTGFVLIDGSCRRPNPCSGVSCATNMRCVNGNCVCRNGFVPAPNSGQGCVRPDPCSTVKCDINSTCVNGNCLCRPGFVRVDGNCRSPCDSFCSENEDCTVVGSRPTCRCKAGFTLNSIGECVGSDPCAGVSCERNMVCHNGACVCRQGFTPAPNGVGCVTPPPDPCRNVNCPANSNCVLGDCVCNAGFVKRGEFCLRPTSCTGVQCGANQRCVRGTCECLPNFVPVPEGVECIRERGQWKEWGEWQECSRTCDGGSQVRFRECDGNNCNGDPLESRPCGTQACASDLCAGITCPGELSCTAGRCECPSGATRTSDNRCVQCTGGKQYAQCAPLCYDICGGTATPVDITSCFGAGCRQGVNCVCPPGQVERSSTDSTCVQANACPGEWRPWGGWDTCSRTCGGGTQTRERTCRGTNCDGNGSETRPCQTNACPGSGNCQAPKIFNACPTRCPKNCLNHAIEIQCESGCRQNNVQCVCPAGMVERSSTDSTCVSTNQCQAGGPCFPNPCRNSGTCIPIGSRYMCDCLDGYSGRHCEIGCTAAVCSPGGRCVRGKCECSVGFQLNGNGSCSRI